MSHKVLKRHDIKKKEKHDFINRFNKDTDKSSFLENFQKLMLERLILNREKSYHPENLQILLNKDKNLKSINLSISDGFILSTTIEADFYILLQEKIHDLTGRYMPMDEFLNLLMTWFYQYYTKNEKNRIKEPLVKIKRNNNKQLVSKFNNVFSAYYENI